MNKNYLSNKDRDAEINFFITLTKNRIENIRYYLIQHFKALDRGRGDIETKQEINKLKEKLRIQKERLMILEDKQDIKEIVKYYPKD